MARTDVVFSLRLTKSISNEINSGNSALSLVSSVLLIIRKSRIVTDFILQSFLEFIMEIIHIHIEIIGFSSDYCNNGQKFKVLDIERDLEDIMLLSFLPAPLSLLRSPVWPDHNDPPTGTKPGF